MTDSPSRSLEQPAQAQRAREQAAAVRRGAGLFRLVDRGMLAVTGDDRTRWLDGMLSADVTVLAPGGEASGCYALLLTAQGRIVADPHVLLRGDAYWLELGAAAVEPVRESLEKHVIADDVAIVDLSAGVERLAVEGPASAEVLAAAAGSAIELAPEAWTEVRLADHPVTIARYGWSGEDGYQLVTPLQASEPIAALLERAGEGLGLVRASGAALEILRVEAGVPAYGAELDQTVLPAEAGLQRAVSDTKGCYIGQEVVARMQSRGRVSHRLVGLLLDAGGPGAAASRPAVGVSVGVEAGAEVSLAGRRVGEVTSSCQSPVVGSIALAFVRSAHAQVGDELLAGGLPARVAALPFVGAGVGKR